MFWHNFKYSVKTLLKNKMLVFWTLAFPILLGIFFHMAFSDIEKNETLAIIPIAIVQDDSNQYAFFQKAIAPLGDKKNKERLFDITYTDLDTAGKLLEKKDIIGYLVFDDAAHIVVHSNGIEESIFRYVVDEMISTNEMIQVLSSKLIQESTDMTSFVNSQEIYQKVVQLVSKDEKYLQDLSNAHMSYTMIEYYTLIAMACLYGGILSMFTVNYKLANMNSVGKRTSISSCHKGKMLLSSLCASYVIQLLGIFVLFVFTIFVLHVDYGTHLFEMLLLAVCGSLAGLCLGVAVATLVKANENAKTGILIAVTMLGCFLSGMMGITMKYVIDKNIPILNKINPASMITDGFYALYYYDAAARFTLNIISLLIFSLVLILLSLRGLRRQKYECL